MTQVPTGAERVLAWLAREHRTQAWLAREVGVDRAVLWRWLKGSVSPRVDFAVKLHAITGVDAGAWRPVRAKAKAA